MGKKPQGGAEHPPGSIGLRTLLKFRLEKVPVSILENRNFDLKVSFLVLIYGFFLYYAKCKPNIHESDTLLRRADS